MTEAYLNTQGSFLAGDTTFLAAYELRTQPDRHSGEFSFSSDMFSWLNTTVHVDTLDEQANKIFKSNLDISHCHLDFNANFLDKDLNFDGEFYVFFFKFVYLIFQIHFATFKTN